MIISLIITIFLLYVLYNTKVDGNKAPIVGYVLVAIICLCSVVAAIVMFGTTMYLLYKGVKENRISTISWLEDLINDF